MLLADGRRARVRVEQRESRRLRRHHVSRAKVDESGKLGTPGPQPGKELAQIKVGDFALGMRFSGDGKLLGLDRTDGKVVVCEVA